ncbi:hypothetical protein BDQ12DRAFT_266819 [Crucibulum laeve]|uniref:Uncharacterized protein n=1 Tax=Crucibulum laeve TaxID=68775 RepID=A0A5C3LRR2_9AGAR|nr:hypothetical protein BDQ12DRAFT_266819 [Crucibulum laeve]
MAHCRAHSLNSFGQRGGLLRVFLSSSFIFLFAPFVSAIALTAPSGAISGMSFNYRWSATATDLFFDLYLFFPRGKPFESAIITSNIDPLLEVLNITLPAIVSTSPGSTFRAIPAGSSPTGITFSISPPFSIAESVNPPVTSNAATSNTSSTIFISSTHDGNPPVTLNTATSNTSSTIFISSAHDGNPPVTSNTATSNTSSIIFISSAHDGNPTTTPSPLSSTPEFNAPSTSVGSENQTTTSPTPGTKKKSLGTGAILGILASLMISSGFAVFFFRKRLIKRFRIRRERSQVDLLILPDLEYTPITGRANEFPELPEKQSDPLPIYQPNQGAEEYNLRRTSTTTELPVLDIPMITPEPSGYLLRRVGSQRSLTTRDTETTVVNSSEEGADAVVVLQQQVQMMRRLIQSLQTRRAADQRLSSFTSLPPDYETDSGHHV